MSAATFPCRFRLAGEATYHRDAREALAAAYRLVREVPVLALIDTPDSLYRHPVGAPAFTLFGAKSRRTR